MSRNKNKGQKQSNSTSSPEKQQGNNDVVVAKITTKGTIIAAIISAIAIIASAIFASPYIEKLISDNNSKTPSPTPLVLITETGSAIVSVTPIFTLEITPTASPTETIQPTSTETPTAILNSQTMFAQMTASASEGKVPFTVNFNAKSSYVDVQGGDDLFCTFENVCNYTWSVRLDGNNVYGPTLGGSAFSFTFSSKGSYIVVVNVCRGKTQDICNFAFANFTAK